MMRFPRRLLLLLVAACGGDSLAPPIQRGMRIVQGAGVSDTVTAIATTALVIEVHDSTGVRAPLGTVVRFTGTNVVMSQLDANLFTPFVAKGVDDSGRAAVLVRLGTVAGSGTIAIAVPTLGIVDTARYTILPGLPSRVLLAPLDTLLGVGHSFRYRGGVTDQYNNRREDPITWSVDPAVTVTNDGTLTVSEIGRYRITATATIGGVVRTSTAQVTGVPNARIAAWRDGSMTLMDFDGGNFRVLAPVRDGGIGPSAQWMPTRDAIVYSTVVGDYQRLYVTDTLGVSRPFFTTTPPNMTHQAEPRVAAGGEWLIFGAYAAQCGYCLHRARIDGTNAELLSSTVSSGNPVFAPSPDGSRIAVFTGSGVRMFDVATKTLSSWTLSTASGPAWSPDGAKIAVLQTAGGLSLINPDGSTIRTVTATRFMNGSIAWLPDSRFLVARTTNYTWELIDTQTSSELLVPFPGNVGAVSIR